MTSFSQMPVKSQASTISAIAFVHEDFKILTLYRLNKSQNESVDNFGVLHGSARFAPKPHHTTLHV